MSLVSIYLSQSVSVSVIIIKSQWQHGYPWLFLTLAIRPYHSSFLDATLSVSNARTELRYVCPYWLANIGASLYMSELENIAYEFVHTYPAVTFISCSS